MDEHEAETWAGRLLEAARTTGAEAELAEALDRLTPRLTAHVLGKLRCWRPPDPAVTPEDLAQEVIARMFRSPPTEQATATKALARVLAWANTTLYRLRATMARRARVARRLEVHDDEGTGDEGRKLADLVDGAVSRGLGADTLSAFSRAGGERSRERAASLQEMRALRDLLASASPARARFIDALATHPDATDDELAEVLGTSRANVYQLRHRVRTQLVSLRAARASEAEGEA